MSSHRILAVFATAALGFATFDAGAVPIYTQGPQDGGEAFLAQFDAGQNADRFTLAQDVVLTTISWWGTAAADAGYIVRIFGDDGGLPALDPLPLVLGAAPTAASTGLHDSGGNAIYRYDLAGSIALAAGDYYLAVAHSDEWYWLTSASGDDESYLRPADGFDWDALGGDFAMSFAIRDVVAVAEPNVFALLLGGIAILVLTRRPRRNTPARA